MNLYNRVNGGPIALEYAYELTGYPYVWGGIWPQSGGTDCDGLATWSWAQVGVKLMRPTEITYKEYPLPRSAKSMAGDLLFVQGAPTEANPGHVMMFVEDGWVFQAEETGTKIGKFQYDTDQWEFRTRPSLALPVPVHSATTSPDADELSRSLLITLPGPDDAKEAIANGWQIYKWSGWNFIPASKRGGIGTSEYANFDYHQKKK